MLLRAVLVAIVLEVRRQLPAPLARGALLIETALCSRPSACGAHGAPWAAAGRRDHMHSHGHARGAPGARARGDAMYRPV